MFCIFRPNITCATKLLLLFAVLWVGIFERVRPAVAVPSLSDSEHLAQAKQSPRRPPRRSTRRPRPPRRRPPNRVQPGGGLDESVRACDRNSSPLTAIVPVRNPVYTASAYPTFLFHLPDPPETVERVEFILLSADEREQIYTISFVPNQAGIVPISLPEDTAYALDAGQAYHWYLNLYCTTTAEVPSVNGWVERVSETANLPTSLPTASIPAEGATADLPEIWYDAIAQTAAALATESSPDAQANWQSWLSAIGLEESIDVPIVDPAVDLQPIAN